MATLDIIKKVLEEGGAEQLRTMLDKMSNMEFKRAERIIRENVLPPMDNATFWRSLHNLVTYRRQAFLSGIMAIGRLAKSGELDFNDEYAIKLSDHLHAAQPAAITKLVGMALPLMKEEGQINSMFRRFGIESPRDQIALLLKSESPLTYFVLFKSLKHIPDHQELVRKCCIFIMKRNNDMAFNMACILRTYFGISDMRSNFSLKIEPYELALIDRSYESFLDFLNGKRPKTPF